MTTIFDGYGRLSFYRDVISGAYHFVVTISDHHFIAPFHYKMIAPNSTIEIQRGMLLVLYIYIYLFSQRASKQCRTFAAGQSLDVVWIVRFGVYVFVFLLCGCLLEDAGKRGYCGLNGCVADICAGHAVGNICLCCWQCGC